MKKLDREPSKKQVPASALTSGLLRAPSALLLALSALLLLLCTSAEAQQRRQIPLVGYLTLGDATTENEQEFQRGLRELGYIQGKNISIEWRYADGKMDRLPTLAADLASLKPDVIVSGGGDVVAVAVKNATTTIPIVMVNIGEAVETGLVQSLAHPGGNATGLSSFSLTLPGKQLELIKEIIPKVSRVTAISPTISSSPGQRLTVKQLQAAAGALGLVLRVIDLQGLEGFENLFENAKKDHTDAFIFLPAPGWRRQTKRLVELAIKNRFPTVHTSANAMEDHGGLISYGPRFREFSYRAASYVDKILKGRKPANIPVELPSKFELIINLKTANQIGLTIPPTVLARADKVIR